MSKKITRMPGDEPPPDPARGRRILALRPKRAVETWKVDEATGFVVVTQAKALRPTEVRIARALKGSLTVNRQLDEFGSAIWVLCDGEHTVEEIARALDLKFRERFEPALPRALKFIGVLAERRLVTMESPRVARPAGDPP